MSCIFAIISIILGTYQFNYQDCGPDHDTGEAQTKENQVDDVIGP
jgi:hypothetical protein